MCILSLPIKFNEKFKDGEYTLVIFIIIYEQIVTACTSLIPYYALLK